MPHAWEDPSLSAAERRELRRRGQVLESRLTGPGVFKGGMRGELPIRIGDVPPPGPSIVLPTPTVPVAQMVAREESRLASEARARAPRPIIPQTTTVPGLRTMPAGRDTRGVVPTQTARGWTEGILGGIGGFLTGGPAGAIAGAAAGLLGGGGDTVPGTVPSTVPMGQGTALGAQRCQPPLVRDMNGNCVFPGSPADISVGGSIGDVAVMGAYGAALSPFTDQPIRVRRCRPSMVLGHDNNCYDKRSLRRDERKWPPGRKPLLTGGEMNAITTASRAVGRVKSTKKRLKGIERALKTL